MRTANRQIFKKSYILQIDSFYTNYKYLHLTIIHINFTLYSLHFLNFKKKLIENIFFEKIIFFALGHRVNRLSCFWSALNLDTWLIFRGQKGGWVNRKGVEERWPWGGVWNKGEA